MAEYQNYINGTWCDPLTNKWIENINPANGTIIGMYPGSGEKDIEKAARAANDALKEWRSLPAPKRADYLLEAADYLKQNSKQFAHELCNEMGKPMDECSGDVQEAIDMALFCAGEGRRNLGMVTESEFPNRTVFSYREPVGVVGAITPWNFPMAMPAWKIMPALVTGNTVVLKPAEDTPHSAINLIQAFEHAGLPEGVLNLVIGTGEEAGESLVMQDSVNVISFTGSTSVGTGIAQKCPQNFKRVALEMGGKNAVIVLNDADIDLAVKGIIRSAFFTSGQRCASAGRIIVEKGILDSLTDKLITAANALNLGNGFDKNSDIGPIINKSQLTRIHQEVTDAVNSGAEVLCGGNIAQEAHLKKGFFYMPTFLSSVTPDMPIAREETFGPVASIIPAEDLTDALKIANGVKYGLTAAVFTKDINKALSCSKEIQAGAFFINTACVGAEIHLPFGGMKGSGNGIREGAHNMLDIYTEWKTVAIQH